MKPTLTILATALIAPFAFAIETVEFNLQNLDDFQDPAGWIVVKDVKGDPDNKAWVSVDDGAGILINGKVGKAGNLASKFEHADVEAHIEFMAPKGSNSGIYFQQCYEIQILDSFGKPDDKLYPGDNGGIYERWDDKRDPKGYEGTRPKTNASKAPGEWQSFNITFRAPRFDAEGKKTENARFVKVVHNGVVIHENVEVTGPTRGGNAKEVATGPIRIQGDHGPVAFRKIALKPVTLD